MHFALQFLDIRAQRIGHGIEVARFGLRLNGVKLSAWIQAALTGGPIISEFKLGFGNSATSLQTAEAAATKKPRYVLLPELTEAVTAAQAISTQIAQPGGMVCNFQNPIYVEPGQFVELIVPTEATSYPGKVVKRVPPLAVMAPYVAAVPELT